MYKMNSNKDLPRKNGLYETGSIQSIRNIKKQRSMAQSEIQSHKIHRSNSVQ